MQELASLQAFDALYRYKSLTAAAKAMGLPKSTVSRRLAQLESDLGQALVVRQGNRLHLTEAGKVYLVYCRQALDSVRKGEEALSALRNEVGGRLVLQVHQDLVGSWLLDVMDSFMQQHPDLHVELLTGAVMADSDLDACLWVGEPPDYPFVRERLGWWRYGFYAAPEYYAARGKPQHPSELVNHDYFGSCSGVVRDMKLQHPDAGDWPLPDVTEACFSSDFARLQLKFLLRGRGIGLLPDWLVAHYAARQSSELESCLTEWQLPKVDVFCCYKAGRPSGKVKALLMALRQACLPEWQSGQA